MTDISTSHERDVSGEAPLFVEGSCSACGGVAQRRSHDEIWFHVLKFNAYTVLQPGDCPEGGGVFLQEKSRGNAKFVKSEPHYKETSHEVIDFDKPGLDENGQPFMRTVTQPILCTCTNKDCPGWGQTLPDAMRKIRDET